MPYAFGLQLLHVAQLKRGLKTRWKLETLEDDRQTASYMEAARALDPEALFENSL